ncbi:MAG: hypothetical protein Q4F39_03800 [Bacteroidia bacterium]|nr:hypothetical protein [Bacteroidia bacterium]
MKTRVCILAAMALLLTGCFPASIVTVSPYNDYQRSYTTTVTIPRTNTVTTTTRVTPAIEDLSLYLDLQAVGAAFAQSKSIEEFESLLNNSSYIISNLDLNGDGYVDYLRVVEAVEGINHVFIIQAVLAQNVFQDIATIVVEAPASQNWHVQIIGAPFIYGPNYILDPFFVTRPPIFNHFYNLAYNYRIWHSPWYWGHFPAYYKHPAPLLLGHYQAYVRTYMNNHRYCQRFDYPKERRFKDLDRVAHDYMRNDYGQQHPERSFTTRTAEIPAAANGSRVTNARDIQSRSSVGTTTTTSAASANARRSASSSSASSSYQTTTPSARSSSSTTAGTSRSSASSSSSRSAVSGGSGTSGTSRSSSSAGVSSTTRSNMRSSGSTNTRITTQSSGSTSTVNRNSGTSRSSASPSRGSSSAGSSHSRR